MVPMIRLCFLKEITSFQILCMRKEKDNTKNFQSSSRPYLTSPIPVPRPKQVKVQMPISLRQVNKLIEINK